MTHSITSLISGKCCESVVLYIILSEVAASCHVFV